MRKCKRWVSATLAALLMLSGMECLPSKVFAAEGGHTLFQASEDVSVEINVNGGSLNESGILLSSSKEGATITFDRVFTGEFDLVFDVLPTQKGEADFQYLTFTFTDADDPSQKFAVEYDGKPFWGLDYLMMTTVIDGQHMGRNQDTQDAVTQSGTITGGSFAALSDSPAEFIFRSGDKGVYRRTEEGYYLSLDLDNASMVGKENVQTGFSRYTVSVSMTGFTNDNSTARILLYSLSGQKLGGSKMQNTAGPQTYATAPSKGVVGYNYQIPTPVVSDVIDGEIPFDGTVRVLDSRNRNLYNKKTNSFFADDAGKYVIEYIAADEEGKRGPVFRLPIEVVERSVAIQMTLDSVMPQTVALDDEFLLPSAKASSALSLVKENTLAVSVSVSLDGKNVLEKTDASKSVPFKPEKEGQYIVTYVTSDYVGKVKENEYRLNVVKGPAITVSDVPSEGYEGQKIKLPKGSASFGKKKYDISFLVYDPELYPVKCSDGVFTPEKSGAYNVKYICEYKEYQIEKIFCIQVGTSMEDLFKDEVDVEFIPDTDFPEYATKGNGLLVEAGGEGASATFTNPIDLSALGADDSLFEFLPVPEVRKTADFRRLYIYLTDAADPDNRLTISVFQSQWANPDGSNTWCYAQAGYGRGRLMARDNNAPVVDGKASITKETNVGTIFLGSFSGESLNNGAVKPIRIRYDNAKKQVLMEISGDKNWVVLDLDDPDCMGAGKEWKGFSSNDVYLSFKVAESQGGTPRFIIKNVAGQSMSGRMVKDTTEPAIKIHWDNNTETPVALKGTSYPLPESIASDLISGYVENVELTVTDPDGEKVSLKDNTIQTEKVGIYCLTYTAMDHSYNVATRKVQVPCVAELASLDIAYSGEMPKTAFVGEKVAVPAASATGGSGNLKVDLSVILGKNTIELSEDRVFIPEKAGDYKVVYTVTDYLHQTVTFESNIAVTISDKPIVEINGVPTAWVSGKTLTFPDFTALDYNVKEGKKPLEAKKSISIEYDGKTVPLEEDRSYKIEVRQSGDVVTAIYRAEAVGEGVAGNVIEKRYPITVIQPEQVGDYFIHNAGNISISYDNDNAYYSTWTSGERMEYVHPLPAEDFSLQMNVLKSGNGMDSFEVILQDSVYDDIKVSLKVIRGENDQNCRVQVNGQGTEIAIPGSFYEISNEPIELNFSNKNCALTAYGDFDICKIEKDLTGRAFKGFPSKLVRLSIVFGTVSGKAELCVKKLMNQPFYGNSDEQNSMVPFQDTIQPLIYPSNKLPATVDINTKITVPTAKAYDVLSSQALVQVSVTAPDGSMVVEQVSADSKNHFEASMYGTYRVNYTASDDVGNVRTSTYNIKVPDTIPPEIEISGEVPRRAQKGKEVELPDAVVTDNFDKEIELEIYVTDPTGRRKLLDGFNFTPEYDGVYQVSYYAKDDDYSFTSIPNTITVGDGAIGETNQNNISMFGIVAGIVGTIILITLVVLLIFHRRLYKKKNQEENIE